MLRSADHLATLEMTQVQRVSQYSVYFSICPFLLSLLTILPAVAQPPSRPSCKYTSFVGEVSAGQHFARALGSGLTFRLTPTSLAPNGQLTGWQISLGQSKDPGSDYIYPVSPPLRFNGVQILGPNYGIDANESLAYPHEMRFLLNQPDYDRLWPLVKNALWPGDAPRPELAANEYIQAWKAAKTGWLRLTALSYDVDPETESLRRLKFRAEFIVPRHVHLAKDLRSKPAACPEPPR
jgi:hypothetical protein